MSNNYRFKEIKLRAYNKDTKKMIYSKETDVAFALNSTGFTILSIDPKNGNVNPETLGDDRNSVLMQSAGRKDEKFDDIYEGDVLFFRRLLNKKLMPIVGIVNSRDFTFAATMGKIPFMFDYADRNLTILGNVFENTDEELAKRTEEILKKYESS